VSELTVEVYTEFNDQLESIWARLENDSIRNPFQTFSWLRHYQEHIGGPLFGVKPQVAIIADATTVVAVLPFGIRRYFSLNVLEWLGGAQSDYMEPILPNFDHKRSSTIAGAWAKILSKIDRVDLVILEKQRSEIDGIPNPFVQSMNSQPTMHAYQASFGSSWDDYCQHFVKKRILSDSRRQLGRLEKMGSIRFIHNRGNGISTDQIKEIIYHKINRREGGVSEFKTPEVQKFYLNLPKIELPGGDICCSTILLDGEFIAGHLGVEYRNTLYYLFPSFSREKFGRFSPGRLLLQRIMELTSSSGFGIFDFTGGEELYKKEWSSQRVALYQTVVPISVRGYAAVAINTARKHMARFVARKRKNLPRNLLGNCRK